MVGTVVQGRAEPAGERFSQRERGGVGGFVDRCGPGDVGVQAAKPPETPDFAHARAPAGLAARHVGCARRAVDLHQISLPTLGTTPAIGQPSVSQLSPRSWASTPHAFTTAFG